MTNERSTSISIIPNEDGVQINTHISIMYNTTQTGMSCYIPGFEIYFSAMDKDLMLKKSRILTKFYIDDFLKHDLNKYSFKRFVLELHKKGFKAKNDTQTVHSLINNKLVKAQFDSPQYRIPENFKTAPSMAQEANFAVGAFA